MRFKLFVCIAVLLAAVNAAYAQPPTADQVRAAVAKGVSWLAAQQNPDGSWGYSADAEAVTAMALLKLEHHAVDPKWGLGLPSPFDPAYAYRDNVIRGLNWLLPRGATLAIGPQPAGNPDSNGNGLAAAFGWDHHRNYTTALALMAVCQAVEHNRTVSGGVLNGLTYLQVAQDLTDYLVYGQNEGTCTDKTKALGNAAAGATMPTTRAGATTPTAATRPSGLRMPRRSLRSVAGSRCRLS